VNGKSVAIVITTIGDGSFLEALRPTLEEGDGQVSVIVVGDLKTPQACAESAARLASMGLSITWFGANEQREWLSQVPRFAPFLPWNSDNRRNIGVLEAWRRGEEVIVSLDDDNMPSSPAEFIRLYQAVGGVVRAPQVRSNDRWVNPCAFLNCESSYSGLPVTTYPRGYPISRRGTDNTQWIESETSAAVALHLGLWLTAPDVDGATRAATAPRCDACKLPAPVLAPVGARTPISTQNVAIARRLVPAWWYVKMGHDLSGLRLARFGDILQGYFTLIAMEAMGDRMLLGPPLVDHHRNPHSLFVDLAGELPGMALLESMIPLLEEPPQTVSDYATAYLAVATRLSEWARANRPPLWGDHLVGWADSTAEAMGAWVDACQLLAPGSRS
jgi:hypothetical protein